MIKFSILIGLVGIVSVSNAQDPTYPIVHTNVNEFYNDTIYINAPLVGEPFYGQDAHREINLPSYTDNGDGTVTDNITGLMWQQDMGDQITYSEAFVKADTMTLGGYSDWRVPTIKELYSLIQFTGKVNGIKIIAPFIDTLYFVQPIGDTANGLREIDAQTWSATQYKGLTMYGDSSVFGVNFLDGRIKSYPKYKPNGTTERARYFRMVRSNTAYGQNNFIDNQDSTITDSATYLMWQQADDGVSRDWKNALSYCENLSLAGYNDWHLPHAKELQSLVDYNRSPVYTSSPAIDPFFGVTEIIDPEGMSGQYPYFWSGTTHLDGVNAYDQAVYIAFGKAQGYPDSVTLLDVHGAGAQRSDPKYGDISNYPDFHGPQGDIRYVYNYCRCVRNLDVYSGPDTTSSSIEEFDNSQLYLFPNPAVDQIHVSLRNESFSPPYTAKVYDMLGKERLDLTQQNSNFIIELNNLSKGSYIIYIQDYKGNFLRKIFIIN